MHEKHAKILQKYRNSKKNKKHMIDNIMQFNMLHNNGATKKRSEQNKQC